MDRDFRSLTINQLINLANYCGDENILSPSGFSTAGASAFATSETNSVARQSPASNLIGLSLLWHFPPGRDSSPQTKVGHGLGLGWVRLGPIFHHALGRVWSSSSIMWVGHTGRLHDYYANKIKSLLRFSQLGSVRTGVLCIGCLMLIEM